MAPISAPMTRSKSPKRPTSPGVDYIEVTNPLASPQSARDAAAIAKLGLNAKVISHARCAFDDAKAMIDTGVADLGLFYAKSRILRTTSTHVRHGPMNR